MLSFAKYKPRIKTRTRTRTHINGLPETSIFTSKTYLSNNKNFTCDNYVTLTEAYTLMKYADEVFVTNSARIEYCLSKGFDYENAIRYIPIVENLLKLYLEE